MPNGRNSQSAIAQKPPRVLKPARVTWRLDLTLSFLKMVSTNSFPESFAKARELGKDTMRASSPLVAFSSDP